MVGVAQLVEHRVVVARVAGSSPVAHPIKAKAPDVRVRGLRRVCCYEPRAGWLTWAVARLCAPGRLLSVNTLVVRDGGIEGASTDAAILAGLTAERPVVLGDGGAATAFVQALPHARRFSRRAEWPPVIDDADLVVNATSERDEVLVELESAQVLVDLPYPETATAAAARRAGARVVGGLEVLVAQGAASFELWTGLPAPVEAMRAALGLPP